MITIILPWPDKALSPNARNKWAAIRARTAARKAAWALTMEAIGRAPKPASGPLNVSVTFWPPDARARDGDNAMACMKAACDGIADALGVNDKLFRFAAPIWGEPHKPGRVIVTVTPL